MHLQEVHSSGTVKIVFLVDCYSFTMGHNFIFIVINARGDKVELICRIMCVLCTWGDLLYERMGLMKLICNLIKPKIAKMNI